MKPAAAVALALAFPGAQEEPHFELRSFRIGKKIFATMPHDGAHLNVMVDPALAHAAAGSEPGRIELLHWGKQIAGVRVRLAKITTTDLRALLDAAWRRRAPKKLIAAFDAP